jgi:hypothetical protein
MSLTVVMPLPGQQKKDQHEEDELAAWPKYQQIFNKHTREELTPEERDLVDLLCLSLEWICISAQGLNAAVVAASGNDAQNNLNPDGGPRPQARYPAAFSSVVGVGSLLKDGLNSADYSNRADEPPAEGLAIFGGARDANNKAVVDEAVLGVYIRHYREVIAVTGLKDIV